MMLYQQSSASTCGNNHYPPMVLWGINSISLRLPYLLPVVILAGPPTASESISAKTSQTDYAEQLNKIPAGQTPDSQSFCS